MQARSLVGLFGAPLSTFRYNVLLHKNPGRWGLHCEGGLGDGTVLISSRIVVFMEAVFYDFGQQQGYASA
jgi:hypothetical protein